MTDPADDTDAGTIDAGTIDYATVSAAIEPTGMLARGGFLVERDGADLPAVPVLPDGAACRSVIVIGNVGGTMWPAFRSTGAGGADPLDAWTRSTLAPIAERLGAAFVHPSDEPFQPFQRWAGLADDVWQSPIGLLVHPEHGLWHAYRGAFLFADEVVGLPRVGLRENPCLTCEDQPCLSTCPVDAFSPGAYDHERCRGHVRSGAEPVCLTDGCAARRACPVNRDGYYGPDQMVFHMRAFVGE